MPDRPSKTNNQLVQIYQWIAEIGRQTSQATEAAGIRMEEPNGELGGDRVDIQRRTTKSLPVASRERLQSRNR